MRHPIDPTVDCVFKAILGSNHHRGLLINFINAMLGFTAEDRVASVVLRNPFSLKQHLKDKLSVVDVKAIDQQGREFQIEIQVANHSALPERMLYNWSSIFTASLKEGKAYTSLQPVISIWLLVESLFPKIDRVHLSFGVYSPKAEIYLSEHCGIHVLQLKKWLADDKITNDKERWIGFFKVAKNLDPDQLPDWMQTPTMRKAMTILKTFSEKEENYHLYLSRMDKQRVELTRQVELEQALSREKKALAESKHLRQLLKKAGIDPDRDHQ